VEGLSNLASIQGAGKEGEGDLGVPVLNADR
jgi:hypothetical protein